MIELMLQAENALGLGLLDNAERIYWQAVEHDPANAIAIVGLSRVALERGDERTALGFARKALEVDPENATARRMLDRLEEVIAYRGEPIPEGVSGLRPRSAVEEAAPVPAESSAPAGQTAPAPSPTSSTLDATRVGTPPGVAPSTRRKRGLLGRLLGRS